MARVKSNWWQHRPTLKLRLRAFNAQGARYRKLPVSFADLERAINNACPFLLTACCYCGRTLTKRGPSGASFDHTKPLAKGGENSLENMCFSCSNCNKLKGAWSADFFIEFVGFLQQHGMWADFCRAFRRKW